MTLALLLQTKSVTRTALRLGLSQPSVSRSLAHLREILGDPLLVRSGGGMELTRRAEELAGPIEQWLQTTSSLLQPQTFDPAGMQRAFRVASTDFGVLAVLSPAMPHILREAPGILLEITPFSGDMMQKLGSGELDLIVTGLEPDRSCAYERHLFKETFSCVVRAGHPLVAAGATALSLDDYLAWPHVGLAISEKERDPQTERLGARATERRVQVRLPYFHAAPHFIAQSDAIMTLPSRAAVRFCADHGFARLAAPRELFGFDYWLLWHERNRRDPATMWLADMLSAHCAT